MEEENLYSLQDLVDVESGVLGTWLGQVSSFRISLKRPPVFWLNYKKKKNPDLFNSVMQVEVKILTLKLSDNLSATFVINQ